jgi:hypothetical protein
MKTMILLISKIDFIITKYKLTTKNLLKQMVKLLQ